MFDQLVSNLKQDHPVAQVAAPSRAPIDKLAQHRAYTFAGTIEEKPEEAEYWLEHTTQIVTKQLACSDEHKLECVVALLADEALSWWETTTLTASIESVTWKFFVEEFKKKYISDQYLNNRRNRFLHLKQANKPIEQYVAEFCKYCKYEAEYMKTEKDKGQKFTDGLNDELGPMFTVMKIEDFQILVNRVTATEAKMKAVEHKKSGYQSDKKVKRDDRNSWPSKKAKYHHEGSSTYTPAPMSKFTLKPSRIAINIIGDSTDSNLIYAMLVVEMMTTSGIVCVILARPQLDRLEDEESPDVIAGTVELNSSHAYALTDSGSTHSFICAAMLDRRKMKPEM
ncbi:hypothetical protein V6N13_125190 [Hibiscus sabdariffa]